MNYNSLIQVTTTFSSQQACIDFLTAQRWKDGKITCAHCKHDKVYTLKGVNKRFKCASCYKHFSAVKGTIFENSAIPLQKWFVAIYLHSSHKKGVSSCQLAKDISVTQKTAWFMLSRIRYVLETGSFEHAPDAIIEVDETYVGGKDKNKHRGNYTHMPSKNLMTSGITRKKDTKVPVAGILERDGNVTAKVVENTKAKTLIPFIQDNVTTDVTIMSDEHVGYTNLSQIGYSHKTVQHTKGEYVNGDIHTNGIENFWSQFKRGIIGIYHHTSPKHLNKYVDEFEYRFNTRKMTEAERFQKVLSLSSRRLTYKALIADNGKEAKPTFTA